MSQMDGINRVMQRIADIRQRFEAGTVVSNVGVSGTGRSPAVNQPGFENMLTAAGQADTSATFTPPLDSGRKTASSNEVTQMVCLAARKYGVDPQLAMAVAETESNFSPSVVSSAGAVGVMQLMPDTAKALGVKDIFDPRDNVDGGVRYLKQLLNSFNGDVTKAVAAYNAGPNAVKQYGGVPPYGETKQYVAKVLSLANR